MKSKVILLCVLLFCSEIVDSIPYSEDRVRQITNPTSNWQVDQNAHDAQYRDTDFTQTRNVKPLTIPVIQQDSTQDYYPNQERYTYDGYGYNKSPVELPSEKQLLGNYNTQFDGRKFESYPPRVESYPSQVRFNSQQFRNSNWRSQNQYINSAPSGVLITDSEEPLVNTVQEPYRGPVQYPQPKYVPSSNRQYYPPDRSYLNKNLRRVQFKYPLADNAGDGKYVANSPNRFVSSGPITYENFSEGEAGSSEIKATITGGQRYLQNFAPQSGNIYHEVPAVVADTLADQSENIKYLENYRSTSDLINTAPSINYDEGSPVISEVVNYSLDSRTSNAPVSYESYNNGQAAASDLKFRLIGGRRDTQSFAPQSGIIYNESHAVISPDMEDQTKDRSRSDLSNTAQITNNDDGSPAVSSADNYTSGSRPSNVRIPYEKFSNAQATASQVKPRPTGSRRYVKNTAPQSRLMYDNVPAVTATDILADQSKIIKFQKIENYKSRSDSSNIAPLTNREDSSPVISAVDNTNTDSEPSNPTPGNIENKAPVDISKILTDKPLSRRYAHNYRPDSGSSKIARVDFNNGAPIVIPKTLDEISGQYEDFGAKEPVPINTYSGPSPSSTDTESDEPPHGSIRSIPSNTNLNHKPSSGITEFSLVNLLSKTDIEKIMAGNTKRFVVIHPNKTVEYVDNIDYDSQQNSKLRMVNTKPKNVEDSDGYGTRLPENVKENLVDETNSNLSIEDFPENYRSLKPLRTHAKQQADSVSLKPLTPLSLPLTPLVYQAGDDDTPYEPYLKNQPEQNQYSKTLRPNIRHPVHHYESKDTHVYQPADYNNSNPSFSDEVQSRNDKITKKSPTILAEDDIDSKPLRSHKRHRDHPHKLTPSSVNQSSNVDNSNPSHLDENQLSDNDKPLYPYKIQSTVGNQLAIDNNTKSLNKNRPGDENDSNSSSPDENQPAVYSSSNSASSAENQPEDVNKSNPSRTFKRQPSYHQKQSEDEGTSPENNTGDENFSNSSSPGENQPSDKDKPLYPTDGNQLAIDNNSKPQPLNQNRSGDENYSNSLSPDENQPAVYSSSNSSSSEENQPEDFKSNSSRPFKRQPSYHQKESENEDTSPENKIGDVNISNSSSPDENEPEYYTKSKPLRPYEKQSSDDSKPTAPDGSKTDENPDFTTVSPTTPNYTTSLKPQVVKIHKNMHIRRKSTTSSPIVSSTTPSSDKTSEDQIITISPIEQVTDSVSNVLPVSTSTITPKPIETVGKSDINKDHNNEQDVSSANSLSGHLDSISNKEHTSTTIASPSSSTTPTHKRSGVKTTKETVENANIKTNDKSAKTQRGKGANAIQSGDDDSSNSSSLDENEPEDYMQSKPLRPYEKQLTDVSKPTAPVGSKTDENPDSMAISPTTPDYTTSPKPQAAKKHKHRHMRRKSTTSSPIVNSSTPSLEVTSEDQMITISPIEQVTDIVSDVPQVSTASITPKPIETVGKSDTINDDNNKQGDNSANSSSGHLDSISNKVQTSTTTASPSSSTTPTDNTSDDKPTKETVENSKIKTNNIAVDRQLGKGENHIQSVQSAVYSSSEMLGTNTDVAGSTDNNKSLLISIDTDDHSDNESKTSLATAVGGKSSDCKKDHNDDGRGKNLEIDLSNIQEEPTMWIRTTNQDIIEKLTEINDTVFDVIYFFNMVTQPVIEREKETTFYCNGTVVIKIKETTYPNKDDSTPSMEKTIQTMQIEDYKRYGLE